MQLTELKLQAIEIRKLTCRTISSIGIGHLGGSLSVVDLLTALYFGGVMNVDPQNPRMEGRDRLIVSKGHSGPAVYATLAARGYFPVEDLDTLNRLGTMLPSHCDMQRTVGIDMTTGSLGQGFSAAVGVALGSRLSDDDAYIYTLIGDGESQEGQVWEAAMYAGNQGLGHLIGFCDNNNMQIDGLTSNINSLEPLLDKWRAFNWHAQRIDGHDIGAILDAIDQAKQVTDRPSMIIMDTVKGKGVRQAEEAGFGNHNMPFSREDAVVAIKELDREAEELRKEAAYA